jgi:hypothetical protein
MARVRGSSTPSNSNLVGRKRVAKQSSQPEIYHLFCVRVSAGARCLPEDVNGLWPISASHWPISGSLVPVLPFPRTFDEFIESLSARPTAVKATARWKSRPPLRLVGLRASLALVFSNGAGSGRIGVQ